MSVTETMRYGPWFACEQPEGHFLVFEENAEIVAAHAAAGHFGTPKVCRIEAGEHAHAYARAAAAAPALMVALDRLLEAMADSECADPGRKYAPEALEAAKAAETALAQALGHDWRDEA